MPDLDFLEDDTGGTAPTDTSAWKILVVDDEPDVHRVTALILANFRHDDRPIVLIRADSAAEAREILRTQRDIALALVDVVMERRQAGLELVNHIRDELGDRWMRIVLRTGQPGDAPELAVVRDYDISDYREKSKLGSNQLITVVRTNLTTYDALRQLDRAHRELEAINEDLSQFNQATAHDLQSPLRHILSFATLLRNHLGDDLDARGADLLGEVEAAAARMNALIAALLALSKIGREGHRFEPVDCNAAVAEACANLQSDIDHCGGEVDAGRLPTIRGIHIYMVQLFQNLIGNSLKYNRSERPRVRIDADADDAAWILRVADNGIGIDPQEAEHIFRPYQRGSGAELAPGTGIGLATCRKVVDYLGGEISAQPLPDTGSLFRIRLPMAEAQTDERRA